MLRYLIPLTFLAGAAAAQGQQPMAGEGLRVARQWCASCHIVARDMPPPATDTAPTFAGIATRPTTTETSLRVFLQTPHANMPNWQLSQAELDAVIAHILSLAR